MAKREGYPPDSRVLKLQMAKTWAAVLADKGVLWGLTAEEVTDFTALVNQAEEALARATDKPNRSHQDVVHCGEVFKTLLAEMNRIKNNHFQSPPRTAEELAMLGLEVRKEAEPVEVSLNQVIMGSKPLADHLLRVTMRLTTIAGQERAASNYGKRIFAGIEDPDAAAGAGNRYGKYLGGPPLSDTDFSWSVFTRKGTLDLDFDGKDRGKKVWFIARLEIAKGGEAGKGGLGPLFWTIIP